MHVSIVIPSFYPAVVYGGPIFATLHAVEALSDIGISVYVSTTNANGKEKLEIESGRFIKRQENFFVKYYDETIVNRFSLSMLFGLWWDIRKADIVHVQSAFSAPSPIALFYARLLNKKVLFSPRGSLCKWCLNERKSFKEKWLRFFIAPFASHMLWHATSEEEKRDIRDVFPEAKVVLISDGVNCAEFDKEHHLDSSEYMKKFTKSQMNPEQIIVSMGRLHKVKGFDILLESFSRVLKIYPNAVLLLAGEDDGEQKKLEELTQKLQIKKNVFFAGALYNGDKRDFLANADLFVLPSHTENFGIVYAESLAAGTPIVASKNTPWSEVMEADCGKWINNTVDETANAIIEMLEKDRDLMRINSKKLAKKYDWKNIAVQFKEVFEEMINEK